MPDAKSNRIIILLEADPDYSAEYALALATITTFAQQKATNQRALHIKVATVSWESIHPVTKQLFHKYVSAYSSISEFLLTKYEPYLPDLVTLKDLPSDLLKYGTVSNDSGSLCLRFRDAMYDAEDQDERNTVPSQWDPWIATFTTKGHYASTPAEMKEPEVKLQMLHMNADSRIAEPLPSCYTVSILASPTVPRVIFDRRSHQLLHTFLWISESEERQQLSWRVRVQSYHPPDVLCLDHFTQNRATERRLKIRNEHAEGFMAALIDYMEWPQSIWELINIVRIKDDVFNHIRDRFIFSGLSQTAENVPKLPPRSLNANAFYAILPQLYYDSRVAHFLTTDTSPLITMLRVHLAPMLTAANGPLELLHIQKLDSGIKIEIQECLIECSLVCDAGEWVRRSTLWATAGLAGMIDVDDDDVPCPRVMTPLADGSIRVLTVASAWLSEFSRGIDRLLRANGMQVQELASFRESVNEENYKEISRDLLRAYSHQVAFASKPKKKLKGGELPKLYDFMTKKPFNPNLNLAVIDWDDLFSQEKVVYGVYTHLKRLGYGGTTVCNWTWIPGGVWDEFEGEMENVRAMKGGRDTKNSDEFWQTKF
ncbi:hypothetical protein H9Q72_002983 [Fusarium xylarioides]|uniref:Uncharacterized protein n=1 Tax=Fusarium xylarioides TaxID=221167 RepID=A0A9P7I0U1_9HYPO|nr:hypothetical protein H9Q70_006488 [Fusarium xylarioides]KAG5769988.1 hypothetical protein H9Q72_002983 [Fusarium xylarioides]KAG5814413.1 hypothetical protein H9Q71_003199 [Fusarium xylarioides]KAG5827260.1 hypothetical protein H9Q74_002663 [Fusarium xylarioides]